jgi:hypothetical protein
VTSFVLPAQVAGAGATGWGFSDWSQVRLSATADASGVATVTCPQVDPSTQWLVDRLVVQSTSTASASVKLYDSTVAPASVLDGTATGNLNSADYPQGLLIRPAASLIAQWTGATPGAVCTLTAQVRIFRRADS